MIELLQGIESTSLATWVRESGSLWGYPLILTFHTIGLGLVVGGSAVVDLRVLGAATEVPLAPLGALFPVMWAGFALNATTGALLFMSDASTKGVQMVFWIKLAFIALAVSTMVVQRKQLFGRGASVDERSPRVRGVALVSLLLWAGAISAGRLMAYL